MYKQKLTPEESLEVIKYRMKYDVSKTSEENRSVGSPGAPGIRRINEQENDCPNQIELGEIKKLAEKAGNTAKKMELLFIRMGYGEERSTELYNIIKSLENKNVIDDITGECVNALYYFQERFKNSGSRGWFQSGFDLKEKIQEFIDEFYEDDPRVTRYLKATLDVLKKGEAYKKDKRGGTPAPAPAPPTPAPPTPAPKDSTASAPKIKVDY